MAHTHNGEALILVPGSSRVKDALGDTIPPAPPVLRRLFNLVPADAHFPEIFLEDIFQVLLLKPYWGVYLGDSYASHPKRAAVSALTNLLYFCLHPLTQNDKIRHVTHGDCV